MRSLLLLGTLIFCFGSPANLLFAVDYFVSETGSDGNTGLGPADGQAFRTIGTAIAAATTPGDTITLGAGTWNDTEESFPLQVPDGITIQGAGSGATTVNGEGGTPFRINGGANATILADMTLQTTDSSGLVVRVQNSPDDLRVSSCVIDGGAAGVWYSDNVDGAFGLQVRNCSFVNQSGAGVFIDQTGLSAPGMAQSIQIVGNSFTLDTGAVGVSAFLRGGLHAFDLAVNSNTMIGGQTGVDLTIRCTTSGSISGSMSMNGNRFAGQSLAAADVLWLARQDGNANHLFDFSGNTVSSVMGSGPAVNLACFAQNDASVSVGNLNCGLMSNVVSGNSATGVALAARVDPLGDATINLDLQYNCIVGNGLVGLLYSAQATTGTAVLAGNAMRNIVASNSATGVLVATVESGGNALVNLFFGNSATSPGYNTFRDNGALAGFDFKLSHSDSAISVSAMCNWWGTSSLSVISSNICDFSDNASLATLLFDPIAPDSLSGFTADVSAWVNEGDAVVITAALGTTFLDDIAGKLIAVSMGGLPVENLVVAGNTLSFTVPVGIALADALIVITNPGGQTGSLLLAYLLAGAPPPGVFFPFDMGGGPCFVATASFGNVNAPEVQLLHRWRDEHLAKSALGRAFVRAYYAHSPALAQSIASSDTARTVTRAALAPIVGGVRLWMEAPWLIVLGGALVAFRALRKRR